MKDGVYDCVGEKKDCSRELSPWWPSLYGVETSSSHRAAHPQRMELTWMMRMVMMFKRKTPCPSVYICTSAAAHAAALLSIFCLFSLSLHESTLPLFLDRTLWYICTQLCMFLHLISLYNDRYLNKWSGLNVFCDSCIRLQSCLILHKKTGSKKNSPVRLKELFNYRVQWGAHQSGFY